MESGREGERDRRREGQVIRCEMDGGRGCWGKGRGRGGEGEGRKKEGDRWLAIRDV